MKNLITLTIRTLTVTAALTVMLLSPLSAHAEGGGVGGGNLPPPPPKPVYCTSEYTVYSNGMVISSTGVILVPPTS